MKFASEMGHVERVQRSGSNVVEFPVMARVSEAIRNLRGQKGVTE